MLPPASGSLAVAVRATVAGAVYVAPVIGAVSATVGGVLPPAAAVYASTSVTRLYPFSAFVIQIRIFDVLSTENVNCRHTSELPETVVPGTVAQALPVQYCTSKSRIPYCENVIVGVGSLGEA